MHDSNYVFFRENSNTHEEEYVEMNLDAEGFVTCEDPADAMHFATAGEAYDFAKDQPALQWWKVGLR